jgi:hypothetical protein
MVAGQHNDPTLPLHRPRIIKRRVTRYTKSLQMENVLREWASWDFWVRLKLNFQNFFHLMDPVYINSTEQD